MNESKANRLITCLIIFAVTFLLVVLQPLSQIDRMITDAAYQRATVIDRQIKIIKIDEKTLAKYGATSNWSRDIPAMLVDKLNESEDYRPTLLVFDIMYIGEKDEQGDAHFAQAVEEAGNVITAANIVYKTRVDRYSRGVSFINSRAIDRVEKPYDALLENSSYGFANTLQDSDGYVRETQLWVEDADYGSIDSLSYAVYRKYQEINGRELAIPKLDGYQQTEFTFAGNIGDYEAISMCDVIDGNVDARVFKNCVVFVGAYAPGLQDSFNVSVQKGAQMYGVEIHANIFDALLHGRFSQPANIYLMALIMGIVAVLLYILISRRNMLWATVILVAFLAAQVGAGVALRENGITICLFYPIAAFIIVYIYKVFSQYLVERIRRKKTMSAFKKYVAPQIVDELSRKNGLEIKLGGENRDIAVLFVDIRGFTTMSETLEPEQVVGILNEYLSLTTKAIFDNMGTLDKFVGDATMAVFNAPFDLDDYIYRAVCAARDIAAGSAQLEAKLMEKYGKSVGFGIGVNCGPAVVGNIGCDVRMDYTAIGDTVNTAARLESNAARGQILISDAVYQALKDRISVTPVGEIPLKGKSVGVMVYSVDEVR